MKNRTGLALVTMLVALQASVVAQEQASALPEPGQTARPWTYWWWMGSAVDKENLTAVLEQYAAAGLGGLHIIPIYGVKGEESRFVEYLSEPWMGLMSHTVSEAKRLGLGVDMTTGTGWPFGGPTVRDEHAVTKLGMDKLPLKAGEPLSAEAPARLWTAVAYYRDGRIVDVTEPVRAGGWTPDADGSLYRLWLEATGLQVERAAPGGAGLTLDPFSTEAIGAYLERFTGAFGAYEGPRPRAQYHDSYEYSGANVTGALLDRFQERRGYDLREHLPALNGEGDPEVVARVRHDYRQTLSDLLEAYTRVWVDWSHGQGFLTRNQAHGSPGNLLDLYALADIPETEIFGSSGFPIPGLRVDGLPNSHPPDPLVIRMASSAAHVAGKPLVSSESCTWLGEHFRVALSQAKPELDQLWTAGVNHVFYHGIAYSPPDAPWPGWLFYASTNFAPSNPQWPHFKALNAYVARVQSALQSGSPDNDVLLYFPISDFWQQAEGRLDLQLTVHDAKWLEAGGMREVAQYLLEKGYAFDYVSDRQITSATAEPDGTIRTPGGTYKVLLIPPCRLMPVETMEKIVELTQAGATVVFTGDPPADVPGLLDFEGRRQTLSSLRAEVERLAQRTPGAAKDWQQRLPEIARRESLADAELRFVRRREADGHRYFITNLGAERVDRWVPIAAQAESAVLTDPMTGRQGRAAWKSEGASHACYLQLGPGESCLLRTYEGEAPVVEAWRYLEEEPDRAGTVTGPWEVTFLEGGPELTGPHRAETLESWTNWGEKEKDFSGLARYRTTFTLPEGTRNEWLLDLGDVRESARVVLNGQEVATLFAVPFRTRVGGYLKAGENELVIEVANLGANRIAALDRQGVVWRKFYEINFVNIKYKPFDAAGWEPMPSGLLGPVRLVPAREKNLSP